ncbi:DUF6092 family protein [Effusibacillus lacus]|uniref:Uncharacterized protein n=1 Tax=Effusibacillus lacus TaxID=1348429 RepID=A0A292YS60_9BACL|nr:DUF6092 family protein [Effusibacillus lacus]TCS75857.1 hypothetical protein EDD64_10539 [Effusibacillus lacus]GAX91751.1 hypothetical protein EFBL_3442 [Effusibacillus lacus]
MTNTEKKSLEEGLQNRLLDYVSYVLTSARGLYKEPHSYGPMRMVDSLEKALFLLRDMGIKDDAIEESVAVIRENRWRVTSDPEAFAQALDDAILRLVKVTLKESSTSHE